MSLLSSKLNIVIFAAAIGLLVSLWIGTAAKIEAEMGLIGAHLMTIFPVAGLSWLVLMVARHVVLDGEAQNG